MKRILLASSAALVVLLARPAAAAIAQNVLTVSATVVGHCTIDPAALTFATAYDSQVDVTATTNITVHCTYGATYWIGLGLGSHASGATRRMSDGTNFLTYELYRDAGFSQVWDNADPAPTPAHDVAGTPGFTAYTTPVYGRILAAQSVPPGAYGDSVVMTVNF